MKNHGSGVLQDMLRALENRLGREVLIPCTDSLGVHYCEVCYKDDPSRISCPIIDQQLKTRGEVEAEFRQEGKKPSRELLESLYTAVCPKKGIDYSYWSGYDDGTICDCGSPFVIEVITVFSRGKQNELPPAVEYNVPILPPSWPGRPWGQ